MPTFSHSLPYRTARIVLCGLALTSVNTHSQPRMSAAEAAQLYTAAGFQIIGNRPANRCGKPAQPHVTFADINADRRPEALFIDTDAACYAPSGRYFAVLVKDGAAWRPVMSGTGSIQALATRTGGWLDMRVSGATCTQQLHYGGKTYESATDCGGQALASAEPSPSAAMPKQRAKTTAPVPSAQSGIQPAAPPDASAAATTLSAADEAAAFKAAGLKKRAGKWQSGCGDPGTASYQAGRIDQVVDANGDGRPEAVIDEGSVYCYGGAEHGYWVVSKTASGAWQLVTSGSGSIEFLKTKGASGWPDISIGGPGFCFPVERWNGKEYKLQRWEYEGKACKPPR